MRKTATFTCMLAVAALTLSCERKREASQENQNQGRTGEGAEPRMEPGATASASGTERMGNAPGTGSATQPASQSTSLPNQERRASANFKGMKGKNVGGKAQFEEVANGVKISVAVDNAPPGMKGIHIHEKADCSDFEHESMGKHFSPEASQHGMPSAAKHHLGDLGNIEVATDGNGRLLITVMNANLKPGDPMSLVNRAIVIDEGKDIGMQPSGAASKPLACAEIRPD